MLINPNKHKITLEINHQKSKLERKKEIIRQEYKRVCVGIYIESKLNKQSRN